MSRPIDDILHYFKSRGINLLDDATSPHQLIAEHWASMAEDVGLKAHGEMSGSIACDEHIRHLRADARKSEESK